MLSSLIRNFPVLLNQYNNQISTEPFPPQIMIDQKQSENVEYFNCSVSMVTDDAKCAGEITSSYAMAKAIYSKNKILFTSKLDLNLRSVAPTV
jgi:hypothetical protein